MSQRRFLLLLILIVALGVFLRFFKLAEVPVSLYWDEVAMLADARFLAETGRDMHGNPWHQPMFLSYGDYKLPVYIWMASISVKVLGVTEFALRLPSAVIGTLTLLLAGLLAREFVSFNKTLQKATTWRLYALCSAFVVALAPWSIVFSRTGFEGHVGQFFLGLAVLFALWSLKSKLSTSILLLLFAHIMAAIATYTYFSVRFVWPVVFVLVIALLYRSQRARNMKRMVGNLMSLALYFLFLIPMIASPLYSESTRFRLSTTSVLNAKDWAIESNILREVSGNSLVDRLMYHRYSLMGKALLQNYSENLSLDFLFINGDPNLRHGTGTSGLFLLPFLPFLFIGFYFFYHKSKPHLLLLVVWWLAALLPASVPETTPHALRSLNALLPVSILIGTGLATSIFYLFRKSWLGAAVSAGYIGIILFALVRFGAYYFSSYPETSAPDWQAGFKEMVLAIEMRKDPVRTVWVDVNDDRFYLWQLAYGNYPLLEVQASLKNRHEPDSIQNIRFEPFLWDGIDTLDHKIAIAGTTAEIDEQLEISKLVPQWRENIEVPKGGEPLSVIGIGE